MDNGVFRDFMKDNASDRNFRLLLIQPQRCQEVPGNSFPFTVGVSREKQRGAPFSSFLMASICFLLSGRTAYFGVKSCSMSTDPCLLGSARTWPKDARTR